MTFLLRNALLIVIIGSAVSRQACEKAIADGSYQDPNISLDGMIRSPTQK
jgi:hypothetical protein